MTHMDEEPWMSDWQAFAGTLADDWRNGLTESEIAGKYQGIPVTWEGQVARVFPGGDVGVHMPTVTHRIKGRLCTASSLLLKVAHQDLHEWKHVRVGDRIVFEAVIRGEEDNPFAPTAIQYLPNRDGTGRFSISISRSRLISVVSRGNEPPMDDMGPAPSPQRADGAIHVYRDSWDTAKKGWSLRALPVLLWQFSVSCGRPPSDEAVHTIYEVFCDRAHCTRQEILDRTALESGVFLSTVFEATPMEAERMIAQLKSAGIDCSASSYSTFARLVPVSPMGSEVHIENTSLAGEVVDRMVAAGRSIIGDSTVVQKLMGPYYSICPADRGTEGVSD